MVQPLFTVVVFISVFAHTSGQTTDNTDVCLKSAQNGFFDMSWCSKLTRPEGCRLGIVNLLFAAAEGDTASLRKFHASGMDMSLADYDLRAAIHLTAAEGHLEATKFLLEEAKVPPFPKDRWGNLPMDEAMRFGRPAVVEYLKAFMAKPIESYESDIVDYYDV